MNLIMFNHTATRLALIVQINVRLVHYKKWHILNVKISMVYANKIVEREITKDKMK